MKAEDMEKKDILRYLFQQYEKFFKNGVDNNLYENARHAFLCYIHWGGRANEKKYLQYFAKEYFKLRNAIIFSRNDAIEVLSSTEYKENGLIAKINHRNKINKLQKLCNRVCKFEQEYYDLMNISLLAVENQRWCEDNIKSKSVSGD